MKTNINSNAIIKLVEEVTQWRHELHRIPETSFQEEKTAGYVAEKLSSFGLNVSTGIAKTGVVATLSTEAPDNQKEETAIGFRADIDGLDLLEKTGLPYQSTHPGKMHACGHDGHTAMLLGAAKYLSEYKPFKGTLHFIFQPAEENEGGAYKMIQEGLFTRFPMKQVFGMHNFPGLPLKSIAIAPGPVMAACDVFDIILKGKGGHAAMPQECNDLITASAALVSMGQTITSRNVNAIDSAVVSFTSINGGTAYNIMPDEVHIKGTVRTLHDHVCEKIKKRIQAIVDGVAGSFNIEAEFLYHKRYPVLANHFKESDICKEIAVDLVGKDNVITNLPPLMGSEDFAFMVQEKPGAYISLGAGVPESGGYLHHPAYDFNDAVIPTGMCVWIRLAETVLPK